MEALQADVASVLERWREVTAPLDHARAEKDATHHRPTKRPATTPPRDDSSSARPPCHAWSHTDFLDRVASFGVATWFAKPLCISPLVCAQFGWRNTASDLLQCAHCERVLCFRIDSKLSAHGAEAVATRFAKQLDSAHDATCPWSHNASPESFTMLPLLGPSQVAEKLWERMEALLRKASTHVATRQALMEMHVDSDVVTKLVDGSGQTETMLVDVVTKRLASSEAIDKRVILHAAVLSMCGWVVQAKPDNADHAVVVVSCTFCSRHVPLNASADTISEETKQETDDARPAKRQRVTPEDLRKPMDPIAQHRWFCPWVVPQRHRDPQDDTRLRETMALVCAPPQQEEQGESLAEFIVLPGWKQSARALRHLDQNASSKSTLTTPLDALASVQSVLALSDASNF